MSHKYDWTMKPRRNDCGAFSWVDLVIILAALLAMAAVLLPALAKSRARSSKIGCTNHLKQIGLGYCQWAIDNGDRFPMSVSVTNGGVMERIESGIVWPTFSVMSNELNTPKILICPQESNPKRVIATTFAPTVPSGLSAIPFSGETNVSYFVGLDADEAEPQRILCGDDNFLVSGVKPKPGVLLLWTNTPVAWTKERHIKQGNIGLADGSVMGVNSGRFGELLVKTGMATNRLALP